MSWPMLIQHQCTTWFVWFCNKTVRFWCFHVLFDCFPCPPFLFSSRIVWVFGRGRGLTQWWQTRHTWNSSHLVNLSRALHRSVARLFCLPGSCPVAHVYSTGRHSNYCYCLSNLFCLTHLLLYVDSPGCLATSPMYTHVLQRPICSAFTLPLVISHHSLATNHWASQPSASSNCSVTFCK